MTPADIAYSAQLMNATNEILEGMKPNEIKGAINWGDLSCVVVERVECFDGSNDVTSAWRVVIEEASPDAYQLSAAVHSALAYSGFKDVEVQLDW